MDNVFDLELDLSGLSCPLPLLKTKQALNKMANGQTLKVLATDPGSERDFQVFTEQSGNKLLEMQHLNGKFCYLIEKN
jgi:tRNA 2-thiouridine synthesizing protein A